MSVYSRCVDARGTTTITSLRALRQASNPVSSSRRGFGRFVGEPGVGENDEPLLVQYGCTLKPYSDWTASAGTFGLNGGSSATPVSLFPWSLSSAITVSTRLSTPCTYETAEAPSE